MECTVVDKDVYNRYTNDCKYVYNSSAFHELNKGKTDEILYLLFKAKDKFYGALALGIKDKKAYIPYSAPFGFFEQKKESLKLERYHEIFDALESYLYSKGISSLYFKMPPEIYAPSEITKVANCLTNRKYQLLAMELNYQLPIEKYGKDYEKYLASNARKNLKNAVKSNLTVKRCVRPEEKLTAYQIIQTNRRQRGFPLRMTCEQVFETTKIVEHDFFLVEFNNISIAAALIYYVTNGIAQVIYWGEDKAYSSIRPINFLAYELVNYYLKKEIRVLDIGPSTEDGIPNYGLCEFKEGIGCEISPKYVFYKMLEGENSVAN